MNLHPLATMNVTFTNDTQRCYSENNPPFPEFTSKNVASPAYSAIFTALGLTSHLIAFIVLLKSFRQTHSRSRSFFLIFLGGLVVTDFMGLLVTGSIVVSFHATHFNWRTIDPDCHFCNFMGMSMVFYGLSPLLLGASMAIERFIGINCPFARFSTMPKSRTITMVLMVWLIAGCIALMPLMGIGKYHMQKPGSWCFFKISSEGYDMAFSLLFSLVGLFSIVLSFLLNTVSVVTLIKVCCGKNRNQRRRDYEVEMMIQLILIMIIATICWCPMLINILMSVVTAVPVKDENLMFYMRMATCNQIFDPWIYIMHRVPHIRRVFIAYTVLSGAILRYEHLLLWLRFVTWNQILDPWVYILFRRSVIKRISPRLDWSRGSIVTLYPSFSETIRRFTQSSIRTHDSDQTEETGKPNTPPSTLKQSPPST